MATTKQAAPAKKSEGFQGVRGAFWIIVVCAIIAFTLFFTWFGNDMHFQDPGVQDHPADIWGTIYKGGVIVPVIHTLLLTVLAMTIERWLALKTATGTGALPLSASHPMTWKDLGPIRDLWYSRASRAHSLIMPILLMMTGSIPTWL
jgi:hypothetical protein